MEQTNYDVFISYKNTNADGSPSIDSQLAADLFKELSIHGISAFYSNIKLLELGEATYKKAIEEALDQSKIFIAIISCKEFVHSKWIEYERESFHEDILAGRKDGVFVPYLGGDIVGNDIPRSIRNYESFRVGVHTAADVAEFVMNIIRKREGQEVVKKTTSLSTGKSSSAYSPAYGKENRRLKVQADNTRPADMPAINYCIEKLNKEKLFILDAGCAYGYVTKDRFDAIDNAFVIGVDQNESCLEYAQTYMSTDNIVYEKLDLEAKDFDDNMEALMDKYGVRKFDIIFSSLVIHHLNNPNKFLRKLRRYLSADGYIILRGSDDGSVMTYNDGGLVEKVINLHLSTDGISDRANGRKIYHQLITSGYKNVIMKSYIKDLSGLDLDERYDYFVERYAYRKNYLKLVWDKDPYNMEKKNNYEYMVYLLEELENKFADKSFWCCETDFVGIAQKE